MKGTSGIHLDHRPAIEQADAPQAPIGAVLLYFMFWDVKKINLKKPLQSSTHRLESRCSTYEIKFNFKVHQDVSDLIIMRVRACF